MRSMGGLVAIAAMMLVGVAAVIMLGVVIVFAFWRR